MNEDPAKEIKDKLARLEERGKVLGKDDYVISGLPSNMNTRV